MSRIKSLFAGSAIVVGSSAALLAGGIAKADPVPPMPSPIGPGINMVEQLIDPAKAPQLLQQATAMLTGLNAAPPAALPVAAPPSLATASVNLPATAGLPGVTAAVPAALPGTALPGAVPATLPGAVPAAAPAPSSPLSGIPGLGSLPFPTNLAALLPAAGIPSPNLGGTAAAPAGVAPAVLAPAAPIASPLGLFPTSALSALP